MSLVGKLMRLLGFKSYIKIPGKRFDDLSQRELASMIEACLDGENIDFEDGALYEFRLMKYKKSILRVRAGQLSKFRKTAKLPWSMMAFGLSKEKRPFGC